MQLKRFVRVSLAVQQSLGSRKCILKVLFSPYVLVSTCLNSLLRGQQRKQ